MKYKKGAQLFNKETTQKVIFGKYNDDGSAICMTPDKTFITITKEDLETNYDSYAAVEKRAKERRRGQSW